MEKRWQLKTCYAKENGINAENTVETEMNNEKKTRGVLVHPDATIQNLSG